MTPVLVALTDRRAASAEVTLARFAELGRLSRPGSVVFQLRDLELPARERRDFGAAIARVARDAGQLFVVNDRLDLAVLLGADGVHLGEAGIETEDARRLLGPSALITRACHAPERVRGLAADGVLLSPIFEPRKGNPPLGLQGLRTARQTLRERGGPALYALGGVSAQNAAECLVEGADGVALVGGVLGGASLGELAFVLRIRR